MNWQGGTYDQGLVIKILDADLLKIECIANFTTRIRFDVPFLGMHIISTDSACLHLTVKRI